MCQDHDTEVPEIEIETVQCSNCNIEIEDEQIRSCAVNRDEGVYCSNCVIECGCCGQQACTGHASYCECEAEFCSDSCRNLGNCDSCSADFCSSCSGSCRDCGRSLCNNCESCEECRAVDLCSFSCNPRILSYSTKANWNLLKNPWENTVYMGIELEMTFPESKTECVLDTTVESLRNKHIWKEDGSIGAPGGELILTPMTLQYLHKINFNDYFRNLVALGAKSYDAGNCGLHVHINRNSVTPKELDKIRMFFSSNVEFLLKFSKRKSCKLDMYAKIPETWSSYEWKNDRYRAINVQNPETIEFRIFRGTLEPKRFRASLEFVDAMVNFVKSHGITACLGKNNLRYFGEFVNTHKQYRILSKYLKDNKLLPDSIVEVNEIEALAREKILTCEEVISSECLTEIEELQTGQLEYYARYEEGYRQDRIYFMNLISQEFGNES